jgi:hypothetical protein
MKSFMRKDSNDTPLNRTFTDVLDTSGTLRARAPKGLTPSRLRIARGVAIAIGISLSIVSPIEVQANDLVIKEIKHLAKTTLTHKQYLCHNEIVYRESRWNLRAIGNIGGTKQAYGLYQMKMESLKKANYKKQYWKYWYYVVHRYGITDHKTQDANYCKALHHLKTRGWQ